MATLNHSNLTQEYRWSAVTAAGASIGTNNDVRLAKELLLDGRTIERAPTRTATKEEMRAVIDELRAMREQLAEGYVRSTRKLATPEEQVLSILHKSAQSVKLSGFGDSVIEAQMKERLVPMLKRNQVLMLPLLMGGGKAANPLKVGPAYLPDLSEWISWSHLERFLASAVVAITAVVMIIAGQGGNDCGRVAADERQTLAVETPNRPRMLIIPPGKFEMGSPTTELGHEPEEASHWVTLMHRFAIATTEITQGQYKAVTGGINPLKDTVSYMRHPCWAQGLTDGAPAVCVSWYDAVEFCNRLSKLEGLKPAYSVNGTHVIWDRDANGYRLPTEAEWEYAARANSPAYNQYLNGNNYCDLKAAAWFDGNSGQKIHLVASKLPNRWGLFDMAGNAWEWVWDIFAPFENVESPPDPMGPPSSGGIDERVWRGGSWYTPANHTRTASRLHALADHKLDDVGFRIVRTLH
jgi:formylglycine-generating enzyme required for sulfatase activity